MSVHITAAFSSICHVSFQFLKIKREYTEFPSDFRVFAYATFQGIIASIVRSKENAYEKL